MNPKNRHLIRNDESLPRIRKINCCVLPAAVSGIRLVVSVVIIWSVLVVFGGRSVQSQELSPDKFRKMVSAELEKKNQGSDSVGTILSVKFFGENKGTFLLAPVVREGKLVAVYKDDPKRGGVTLVAGASVLKSVRAELFSQAGAKQLFADKGYPAGEPVAISIGPCSLFGVLETSWYLPVVESFVLLSLEGKLIGEADVTRFLAGKLPLFQQIKKTLQPSQ